MSRMTASVRRVQPLVQRWAASCGALVVVALVLCALFPGEAAGALHVWLTSTAYNHCFLILPVALYLAWQRRDALMALAPRPDLRPLLLIVPLSLLWLVAASLSVLEVQQFLVMAIFEVAALSLVGWAAYRALLTPFLYLFFLVPSGYVLVPTLQDFTARFIVHGLELLHIPVYSDGTIIEVPSGTFVVAEACAGLRFLIASIAFGVLFATLMYQSRLRRTLFIALSTVVPIVANGFRGLGLIVISEFFGSANAVMTDHIFYGWLFFSLVTALLIAIGMAFTDIKPEAPAPAAAGPGADAPRLSRYAAIAAASVILAAAGPAYAQLRDWRVNPLPDLIAAPAVAPPWRPAAAGTALWQPRINAPDRAFRDAFGDGGATVMRYVALYRTGGPARQPRARPQRGRRSRAVEYRVPRHRFDPRRRPRRHRRQHGARAERPPASGLVVLRARRPHRRQSDAGEARRAARTLPPRLDRGLYRRCDGRSRARLRRRSADVAEFSR